MPTAPRWRKIDARKRPRCASEYETSISANAPREVDGDAAVLEDHPRDRLGVGGGQRRDLDRAEQLAVQAVVRRIADLEVDVRDPALDAEREELVKRVAIHMPSPGPWRRQFKPGPPGPGSPSGAFSCAFRGCESSASPGRLVVAERLPRRCARGGLRRIGCVGGSFGGSDARGRGASRRQREVARDLVLGAAEHVARDRVLRRLRRSSRSAGRASSIARRSSSSSSSRASRSAPDWRGVARRRRCAARARTWSGSVGNGGPGRAM